MLSTAKSANVGFSQVIVSWSLMSLFSTNMAISETRFSQVVQLFAPPTNSCWRTSRRKFVL